jgi:hypothetical protein
MYGSPGDVKSSPGKKPGDEKKEKQYKKEEIEKCTHIVTPGNAEALSGPPLLV